MFPRSILPPGMTLREFGERLWGRGEADALTRANTVNREELIELGLTREKAVVLMDFYGRQAASGRGLPTSIARRELLRKCVELLTE